MACDAVAAPGRTLQGLLTLSPEHCKSGIYWAVLTARAQYFSQIINDLFVVRRESGPARDLNIPHICLK